MTSMTSITDSTDLLDRAARDAATLRTLHRDGALVLPNAWDAMSAAIIEARGARAIATTSGGVSWGLGAADGEGLTRADAVSAADRIVRAVRVPVSFDIESGFGADPEGVATTVRALVGVGVAGINLEDSWMPGRRLAPAGAQAERVAAARAAGGDLVINARTDVYLGRTEVGREDVDPVAEVIARAEAYAAAGADGLFVPGLIDLATIRALADTVALPLNIMSGPGGPTVAELAAAGVRRISVGTAIAQAAYAVADRAAAEVLGAGTYESLADALAYGDLNALAVPTP